MNFTKRLLVLSRRLQRWGWRLLSQSLVLSLILRLTFRGYETSEVPTPYLVLYLPFEMYAVVRAVAVVSMELAILGVIPCGGV